MKCIVQDNKYSDLDFFNKENLLLSPHVFRIFKLLGFNYIKKLFSNFAQNVNKITGIRLNNMFMHSKKLLEGKISQQEAKRIMNFFHPLFLTCRLDLINGLTNLLYGNSVNLNTILINDITLDITNYYERHLEQGIITEFELFSPDIFNIKDKIMNIALNKAYQATKSATKTCRIYQRFFTEKRQKELTEYPSSNNSIFLINLSNFLNTLLELSNYENLGFFWDYYNGKRIYKLPEASLVIFPNFPFIKTLMLSNRYNAMKTLGRLSSDKNLAINPIENILINWIKDNFPEIYQNLLIKNWEKGIPTPRISLEININYSNLIDNDENLIRTFPKGNMIIKKNFKLSENELFLGYITDISEDFKFKEKISENNITKIR